MLTAMADGLIAWLLSPECRALAGAPLIAALVESLRNAGIPFQRFSISVRTRHPQVWVENYTWSETEGLTRRVRHNDLATRSMYLRSPVAELYAGHDELRVPLPVEAARYPVTAELAANGFTDYLCLALSGAQRSFVSFATRAPGGFSEDSLQRIRAVIPALSLRVDLASERMATGSLLRTYLGPDAARHVLDGEFRLGQGRPIDAVIWSCDLRGFTTLVDTTRNEEVLRSLNEYFECVVAPIAQGGGEVLKFVGDAVLAIFAVADRPIHEASAAALNAAQSAFTALAALNERRAGDGRRPLEFGVALHRGVVTYGNIGALDRLDFSSSGPPSTRSPASSPCARPRATACS